MVNGVPTSPILLHKSVKQENPISPFLFMIVVEGLKQIMDKAVDIGIIDGIRYFSV